MKVSNIFELIPENLDDEVFQSLVQNKVIKIERIISKGHKTTAVDWYGQAEDEWVLLLKGSAIIAFEDNREIHLDVGDHVIIPAHARHRVIWTDPKTETIWLAVHYGSH